MILISLSTWIFISDKELWSVVIKRWYDINIHNDSTLISNIEGILHSLFMVINFCTIVDHGHHVRIVPLVVIVKGIKEHSKAIPLVCTAKHRTLPTWLVRKPQCLVEKQVKIYYWSLSLAHGRTSYCDSIFTIPHTYEAFFPHSAITNSNQCFWKWTHHGKNSVRLDLS